jgi:hypothetical protein
MRYSDFSGKRAFKYDELKHELRGEEPTSLAQSRVQSTNQQEQKIKMVAMHYLNTDSNKAQEYVNSGIKLKQDRHGSWYLPRYNTSGRTYQAHLDRLKADKVVSGTQYLDKTYLGK